MPATITRPARLTSLDGLRGVAALIVVVHHGLLVLPEFANPLYGTGGAGSLAWFVYSPLHLFAAGEEAVVVFFILSGFVLALPVVRGGFHWLAYYASRLLRLYLPVAASLLWAFAVIAVVPRASLLHNASPWMRDHGVPITPLAVIRDIVLVTGTSDLDGPLWSLRWEVLFSLLLPLYVLLALKVRRWWVVGIVMIALVQGRWSTPGIR